MGQPFAIFLDIDGTLCSGISVPEENRRAIAEAKRRGGYVFINTGRVYCNIPEEVRALPVDGYICALATYVRLGDQVLKSVVLDKEVLRQVVAYGLAHRRTICLGGEEHILTVAPASEQAYTVHAVEELDTVYQNERINKTMLPGRLSEEDRAFLGRLFHLYEHEEFAEGVTEGYSKARGIRLIEQYLHIPHERTVAIGDSMNDSEMLAYVALGIAMDNGDPKLKRMADALTVSAGEAGVAHAFTNIVFPAMNAGKMEAVL